MLVLTCPNCSASLELDETREFAFCQYCGTKIVNLNNTVEINRTSEINNLLLRALEFEQKGNYEKVAAYCERILDLDPTNKRAREIEQRLPGYSAGPNVTIVYHSVHDDRFKLRTSFDGRHWNTLSNHEMQKHELPVGKYRIVFSGKKSYAYDLVITNPIQKITLIYTADKHTNRIDRIDE